MCGPPFDGNSCACLGWVKLPRARTNDKSVKVDRRSQQGYGEALQRSIAQDERSGTGALASINSSSGY